MQYRSNSNIVYSCKYHVIWCPKYRRKVLGSTVAKRLKEIIDLAAKDKSAKVIESEITPDHSACFWK